MVAEISVGLPHFGQVESVDTNSWSQVAHFMAAYRIEASVSALANVSDVFLVFHIVFEMSESGNSS
jgi:hypothetical protein